MCFCADYFFSTLIYEIVSPVHNSSASVVLLVEVIRLFYVYSALFGNMDLVSYYNIMCFIVVITITPVSFVWTL